MDWEKKKKIIIQLLGLTEREKSPVILYIYI